MSMQISPPPAKKTASFPTQTYVNPRESLDCFQSSSLVVPDKPKIQKIYDPPKPISYRDIKIGDILVFSAPKDNPFPSKVSKFLSLGQAIACPSWSENAPKFGHRSDVHVAICIRTEPEIEIIHIQGEIVITRLIERTNTPIHIFRPKDAQLALSFAEKAFEYQQKEPERNFFGYSNVVSLSASVFVSTFFDPKPPVVIEFTPFQEDESTICTQFVIGAMQAAIQDYPDIEEKKDDAPDPEEATSKFDYMPLNRSVSMTKHFSSFLRNSSKLYEYYFVPFLKYDNHYNNYTYISSEFMDYISSNRNDSGYLYIILYCARS